MHRNLILFLTILAVIAFLSGCHHGKYDEGAGMIVDRLQRAEHYFKKHPSFQKAFEFLRRKDLSELAPGRHEVGGDRIYAIISKGPGRTRAQAMLEAHRKYIDIQYVISGIDEMGWKSLAECGQASQEYDRDKDVTFYPDAPAEWVKVRAGSFAVFFPQDAHAPSVGHGEIHKAVVKVAVE